MADHAAEARGLVAVGTVIKPHGIRGELCVDCHADSPLLFEPGRTLLLAAPSAKGGGTGRPRPYQISTCREHQGRLLLTFQGIADRDAAETLRGLAVLVPAGDLPEPDEGEVYLHQLLGARVELADGSPVGTFEGILDGGDSRAEYDTWVIATPDGKEILLPAVPEFLLELDPDQGRIRIDPPPGLLELYLSAEPEAPRAPKSERRPKAGRGQQAGPGGTPGPKPEGKPRTGQARRPGAKPKAKG